MNPANIVLSALKVSEDGRCIVLRVYEAAGVAVDNVTLAFVGTVHAAEEMNLLEHPIQPITMERGELRFALRAFEIKTIGLQMTLTPTG